MKALKKLVKVKSGLFIPIEILSKANINTNEVEVELQDREIRIHPGNKKNERKIFTLDSPLWKCVGFAEVENISGRKHDRYIYDGEK